MSIKNTFLGTTRFSHDYEPESHVSLFMALKNNYNKVNVKPSKPIKTEVHDYRALPEESFVWFGHSSFLLRTSK